MGDPGNRVGGDGLRGQNEISRSSRKPKIAMPFSPFMEATIYRDIRRRHWVNVGSLVLVSAIFLVLAFRGGMIMWEGIVASNEPMPVELRDSLPSFEELPSIPPDRSWNV